jgi:hypothetical protein
MISIPPINQIKSIYNYIIIFLEVSFETMQNQGRLFGRRKYN